MNHKEKEEFIKRFSKFKWICNLEKRVVIKKISGIELHNLTLENPLKSF